MQILMNAVKEHTSAVIMHFATMSMDHTTVYVNHIPLYIYTMAKTMEMIASKLVRLMIIFLFLIITFIKYS